MGGWCPEFHIEQVVMRAEGYWRLLVEQLEDRMLLSYSYALIAETGVTYSSLRFLPSINASAAVAFHSAPIGC
jgi:hypothetical protein